MKQRSTLLILFATILFLTSCELYYVPPHIQTYSHKQSGDLSLNVQGLYSGSGSVSYAVTDNLSVGGSVSGFREQGDTGDVFRTLSLEGGYFHFTEQENVRFEVLGGGGTGTTFDEDFEVNFNRWYFQPGVGFFTPNGAIENHLNMRFTQLNYQAQSLANLEAFRVSFFEPAYTFRAGSPNVKFQVQVGLSVPLISEENVPGNFGYTPFIMSAGLNVNFNVFGKGNGLE